jgi:hypothetical protein
MKTYLGNSKVRFQRLMPLHETTVSRQDTRNFAVIPLYGERLSNRRPWNRCSESPSRALSEAFDIGEELSGDLRKRPDDGVPPQ